MENSLFKQLEDKKKELEEQIFERDWGDNFGTKEFNENKVNILQAEIAMLEQAIAEMQNLKDIQDAREQEAYAKGFGEGFEKGKEDARQEILGLIQSEFNMKTETLSLKRFEEIKEKLNQPKTTQ
jgi:flagellar biosynthesis/type III secretory pathway protein FliH